MSIVLLLVAIGIVIGVAVLTVRWLGSGWLLLTMPATLLLGIPVWRRFARASDAL